MLGTGAWEGEYLVATKAFGRLDATIGLGWGDWARSGFSNPLGRLVTSLMIDRKDYSLVESLGEKSGDSFFRGDAAILVGSLPICSSASDPYC